MKRFKRIVVTTVVLTAAILLGVFVVPRNTKAYSTDKTAYKKAMATAILTCYDNYAFQSPLTLQEYDFNHSALSWGSTTVQIPNLNGDYNYIECYELINRYVDWVTSTDPTTESNFLVDKLGYTRTDGIPSGECFYFQYNYQYDDPGDAPNADGWEYNVPTDYICADTINSDGTIGVDTMTIRYTNNDHGGSSFNVEWENHKHKITLDCYVQNIGGGAGSVTFEPGVTKWSDFKLAIQNQLLTHSDCVEKRHSALLGGYTMYLQPDYIGTEVTGDVTASFTIEDTSAAAAKGTAYMLGTAYSSVPSFSKTDTFSLYQAYVTEYYNADIVCGTMSDNTKTSLVSRGYKEIAIYSNGAMQTGCYAKAQDNENEQSVYAVDAFGGFTTFEEICAWMAANASSVSIDELDDATTRGTDGGIIIDPTPTTSGGDSDEAACYRNAGSFGWIMCPTIFGLRGIGEKFYAVAEPFLQTNESIVEDLGSQTSGLYQAWLVFRNIANVIFVIIFMFIIFSQLTGWGIDNYGIKKMLPKLILIAILVNLSYIICAIAVDASNIVGQGVRGLFESVAQKVPDKGGLGNSATEAIGETVKKVVAFITTGGVGLAGVAIAEEISETGLFLIVPVVLFLLTLLASAFFAIIMLGLRQALIVILIVIAPVAFALSVLPNTEAIYKKWFSFAKGMLMVYPVVGAVIGAGYLTARILMNNDQGFIMTIVSGLLMSVPYFMIPSITRKALDAVGVIGTKLTGIGKTGVSKANHAIKGSDLYNNVRADDKANRAQRWMNKRGQKIQEDINSGKKVSMRRANKYARMAGLASSREQANINARSAQRQFNRLQGDGYTAAMSAAQRAEEDTAVKNFETLIENGDYKYGGSTNGVNFQDTEAIGKALEYELSQSEGNIDANKIRALQNVLNRKGDNGRDAIFKAMSNAQSNAQRTGNSVSAAAVRAFSSNIMNNQSSYKSSHRSLYEFAKKTAVSGAGNIDDYKASGIAALTQDSFLNTDATQMREYLEAYKNGSLQEDDKTHLEELAHGIANNQNVHGSIRKDDYGEALKTFAPDVDWSKVYNGEGNGLKVDHSHDAAMAVFQDRLNRKVADGTYTQEKANRLMDKAKHMFDKDHK